MSRAQPTFTIIIPAYNAAATLGATLDSVVAQTYESWEAIIVDDGSADGTAAVAAEYVARDVRFSLVRQSHLGVSAARNAALALSSAELLCFLDADDVYLPAFLEIQLRFASAHPDFDVYSCNVDAWWPDGSRSPCLLGAGYDRVVETRLDDLIEQNRLTVMVVVRRSVLVRLGGFDPSARVLEDYELWVRAAVGGARLLHNPATLALYRQRPAGHGERHRDVPLAQRAVLQSLLHARRLSPEMRTQALASVARIEAAVAVRDAAAARRELERQLDARRFCRARRLVWRARSTYPVKTKFILAFAAAIVSPRLLSRMVDVRRRALGAGRPHSHDDEGGHTP